MSLSLPENPRTRDLAGFRAAILERTRAGAPVVIEADKVTQLPLAWVQLLVSAAGEARGKGLGMSILNPSFAFLFAFELVGIAPEPDHFKLEYGA